MNVNACGTVGRVTTARTRSLPLATVESCPPAPPVDVLGVDAAGRAASVLRALAEPTRLRLISLIAAHGPGGQACVCHLTEPVGLSQPTVSHHLKLLVDAGLLIREQRGKWAYYSLVPGALAAAAATITGLVAGPPTGSPIANDPGPDMAHRSSASPPI